MVPGQSDLAEHRMSGIQWPQVFRNGAVVTAILEADEEREAMLARGFLMTASFLSDPSTILYTERVDKRVRDNEICHEFAHLLATDVLGHEYEFTEADAQGIGNFIHTLLEQVLEAHGVEVYESAMETERTTSLCEIASRGREVAEALAPGDIDGEGGPSWTPGRSDSCGRPDSEARGRGEVFETDRRESRPPGDEGRAQETSDGIAGAY